VAARVALPALLAALTFAPSARAHATVTPVHAETGFPQLLLVTVPNENPQLPLGVILITLPRDAEPLSAEAVEGNWRTSIAGRRVELRGGPIAAGSTASFRLRAQFGQVGETTFAVEERYAAFAASARYTVPFVVTAPVDRAEGPNTMVFVAIGIFGALGAAAFFFLLARWLRG
jgi:uncharacterized protein YcnI